MTNHDERVAAVARGIAERRRNWISAEAKRVLNLRAEGRERELSREPNDAIDRHLAQAAFDALKDNGLVVVPVEPTEAMIEVGAKIDRELEWQSSERAVEAIFLAMIEAAQP